MEIRGQIARILALSFQNVDSKDQTQVLRFGGKHLYTLSHLISLWFKFFSFLLRITYVHIMCFDQNHSHSLPSSSNLLPPIFPPNFMC